MGTALDILITADVAEAVNNINTVADAAAEAVQTVEALPPIPDQTITVDADTTQAASDLSDLSDLSDKKVTVTADASQAVTALDTLPQVPDQTTAVDADTSQAVTALDALPQAGDQTVVVTADTSQAASAIDALPQATDQAISVTADTSQAASAIDVLPQATDRAITVIADTSQAAAALTDLPQVSDQSVTVTADTSQATAALGDLPQVTDQAISVTADTSQAASAIDALPQATDQVVTVTAGTSQAAAALTDLPQVNDQSVTVTADTSQATAALGDLPQATDQAITVTADTSQAASAIDALPQATAQVFTVTADASQAVTALDTLPQVDDQTTTVDADTSQAAADLAEVSDKSDIPDKKFSVYANVKPALADLGKVARLIAKNAAAGAKWAATQAANALKWAVAGSSAALAAGGVALTKYGSRAEDTRLAFRTMLGSMADGDAMMAKLDRFSNSTPYSGDQVNQAAKTLLAFGVAAGDVENTLRKVGDVAAGSGKDFNELSAIYGKVFAKGVMDTEAMNQMVEAGIPIVKTLGAMFGKSGQEIYAMAEKGEITAAAVDRAFAQMSGSGGVFSGMMQKQSETVSGMWGAITGQIAYAASNIGEALLPMLKVVLGYFQSWADKIAEMSADGSLIRWFGKIAVSGVTAVGELIKWSVTLANHFAAAFKTIAAWGKLLWNGLKTGLMAVVTLMVAQFEAIVNVALAAYNAVVRFFGGKGKEINWTWTKASAGVTADTAKETAQNYREATDGRFFAEAMTKNQSFDAAVNKAVSSINNRLSAAVDQAAETQAKRTADIDKKLRSGTIPDEAKRTGTPAQNKAERVDVDQLARVGLYNFSNNDVRSLDIERNNLIRKLLKKDPVKLEIVEV